MATKTKSQKNKKKPKSKSSEVNVSSSVGGIDITKLSRGLRLAKRLGAKKDAAYNQSSLCWLLNSDVVAETTSRIDAWHNSLLKKRKTGTLAEDINASVQSIAVPVENPDDALVVLAACHAIRGIAGHCELEDWQSLVAKLLEISRAAESDVGLPFPIYQQLAIEVPLTIAYQLPEIEDYPQLAIINSQKMATIVSDMLDHDGWPNARYLSEFGPIVASWVRCSVIISELELEQGLEAASQLEWLVRQVFRMLRPDRTLVFSEPGSEPASNTFLKCLLEMSNDRDDKRLLKIVEGKSGDGNTKSIKTDVGSSNISEWSESALLQSNWGHGSPKVAVDFSNSGIRTEISNDVSLICGETMPEVSINGVTLHSDEPFEVACIESDEDIDYLEVEKDMGKGVTLTRQFLLSRNENFLMIADLVVPESPARIDYRGSWPLANEIEGMHETETREIYLRGPKKIQSLVLPIALPEWKVGRTDDKLDFQNRCLCLTQSIDGRGLYAPLFFDLSPKRSKKKRTWRQLTVAENMRSVNRDEACAFRVHLDKQQWIFYRMVSSVGNRTFIGENINSEFVFSRFLKNGTVEQLIEVN